MISAETVVLRPPETERTCLGGDFARTKEASHRLLEWTPQDLALSRAG